MSHPQLRPIYYDTETTGIRPTRDRIIELAAYDPIRNKTFCSLINPQCSISAEASAVSHITDDMVATAPLFESIIDEFIIFCDGNVVLIAHNNDAFDKPFLEEEFHRCNRSFPAWRFIDSLKWSRKYRPDLPRHSLQFLRETYGIEPNQAHRALSDTMVLAKIFGYLIDDLPLETVLSLLTQPRNINRMPFGKHQGKNLSDIPKSYIEWLEKSGALTKPDNAPLREYFLQSGLLSTS